MPDEWRQNILASIFKNKGVVKSCTNYRRIKLMSHTIKLYERIIEHRLRGVISIIENQFSFMPEIDYGGDFLDKETYGEI
jgi:hypothetical protein